MKTIAAYPLPDVKLGEEFLVELPSGGQILHLFGAIKDETPLIAVPSGPNEPPAMRGKLTLMVRALEDDEALPVPYRLVLVTDSQQLPPAIRYIDSLKIPNGPMLHLLEVMGE